MFIRNTPVTKMIRRNARLRREYLYRKGLEGKDAAIYEKKKKIKAAIQAGKEVPTELREEYDSLKNEIDLEDDKTAELKSHIDDEYAQAGVEDPKILLTSARGASSRLTQFVKELRLVFPNSQRINRGGTQVKELVEVARNNDFTDIVIVHEHRGEPDSLVVCHLPYGPTAYFGLSNCVLRHDLPDKQANVSEAYPHLIFDNFNTKLGDRLRNVLKYLFPVPKEETRRCMTFSNRNDTISFRHHVYKVMGHKDVDIAEVGPRFEMKPYMIKLGTIDMEEAECEWALRPYMNTARKRKAV